MSKALDPCTISLIVIDIKMKRFVGLKKDTFEELMHTESMQEWYFCRQSFATWDVLLPTKELAAKLAESWINTKFFQLQPEYMGTRRIHVMICNVSANLPGEVVVS